jgi:hypothetical protein
MVVILGFLGLGIDLGYLRYMKRLVQKGSDAAAIAAAAELPACGAVNQNPGTPACSAMTTAAKSALTENGFTLSTPPVTGSCTPGSTGTQVIINNPPQCVSTDPHLGQADYVEVIVSQVEPLNFATVFGAPPVTLTARSEAAMLSNLVYALSPSASSAIYIENSLVTVSSLGGIVDESASANAFNCNGGATISAPYIGVVGGAGGGRRTFRGFGGCNYLQASPVVGIATPEYGNPPNPDPLYNEQSNLRNGAASVSSSTPTNCGSGSGNTYKGSSSQVKTVSGQTYVLEQGTYCGGISIANNATVVFTPGIYTLTSAGGGPGGLTIDSWASVTANGVGFYNYGPLGGINITNNFGYTGTGVTLTAPNASNCGPCVSAAAWQGILFYQDPQDVAAAQVVGSSTWNIAISGTSYFPKATVTYAMDNSPDYNLLVANQINFGVNWAGWIGAFFHHDFRRLNYNRSPLRGTGGTGVVE